MPNNQHELSKEEKRKRSVEAAQRRIQESKQAAQAAAELALKKEHQLQKSRHKNREESSPEGKLRAEAAEKRISKQAAQSVLLSSYGRGAQRAEERKTARDLESAKKSYAAKFAPSLEKIKEFHQNRIRDEMELYKRPVRPVHFPTILEEEIDRGTAFTYRPKNFTSNNTLKSLGAAFPDIKRQGSKSNNARKSFVSYLPLLLVGALCKKLKTLVQRVMTTLKKSGKNSQGKGKQTFTSDDSTRQSSVSVSDIAASKSYVIESPNKKIHETGHLEFNRRSKIEFDEMVTKFTEFANEVKKLDSSGINQESKNIVSDVYRLVEVNMTRNVSITEADTIRLFEKLLDTNLGVKERTEHLVAKRKIADIWNKKDEKIMNGSKFLSMMHKYEGKNSPPRSKAFGR